MLPRSGRDERQHALTLSVNVRDQDLSHFNDKKSGDKARLLQVLDDDEAFQALVRDIDDLRQLDQLAKTKAKEGVHTLELPDMTVQWQVAAEEPGLPSVLQRVRDDESSNQPTTGRVPSTGEPMGRYRPLPVRKLVVVVWMYPPHVDIPPTGDRIPIATDEAKQDFIVGVVEDDKEEE
ncbi:hypothetical protein P3T76_004561 [Phytophthora citrophthora]|uniref:Uncharacterized protein n=1 Tax=Phytophthora citrophthora TaxID=4793 RepID=A0AAD9LS07_9STRA|nr:hypothetical protein P3T76_004561 [Phytophthora citrophthora]